MNDVNWDDIRLFRLVAKTGSLSSAAADAGISAPTVGRKIQRLEQRLGATLFDKTQSGYVLTGFGKQLLERTHTMAITADDLSAWRDRVLELPLVTISATPEVLWLLSHEIGNLWTPRDSFRLSFENLVPSHQLEHNKSMLLLARTRPTSGNVKVRALGSKNQRVYCSTHFDQVTDCNWIGLREVQDKTYNQSIGNIEKDPWITLWAPSFDGLVTLVKNCAGRAMLPEFVAERNSELIVAEPNSACSVTPLFLISHADEDSRPEIIEVKKRLAVLIQAATTK